MVRAVKGKPRDGARMPKPRDGRVRAIYAAMKKAGWIFELRSGHPRAFGPNGEEIILSSTPSDRHYADAIMRKLTRFGFAP